MGRGRQTAAVRQGARARATRLTPDGRAAYRAAWQNAWAAANEKALAAGQTPGTARFMANQFALHEAARITGVGLVGAGDREDLY